MQFLHTTPEIYNCKHHTHLLMIISLFNWNQRKVYVLILIHKLRSNAVLRWDKWACLRYPPLAIVGIHDDYIAVCIMSLCSMNASHFSFPKFLIKSLLENWGFKEYFFNTISFLGEFSYKGFIIRKLPPFFRFDFLYVFF